MALAKTVTKYFLILIITVSCFPAFGAEFLIYDKAHWMDALTPEQVREYVKKYPSFQAKYDARYQRGDIVEVRSDGYWTGEKAKGFNQKAFRIISVPGLSEKDAKYYMESSPTKRRNYSISTGSSNKITIVSSINDLTITDKDVISETKDNIYFAGCLVSFWVVGFFVFSSRIRRKS